MIAAS
ncbi:hypothetical protein BDFB_015107, partial [Asbolus verrucosus]|jgi:hypothetical protein